MSTLQNIDHQTASFSELHRVATAEMRAEAELKATKAMAKLSNPFCGAREIAIASHLRKALAAERKSVAMFMSAFRK